MQKILWIQIFMLAASSLIADTVIVSDSPTVVRNAEIREALKNDSTWTAENVQKNPYLFLQDQIRACDGLLSKIEAQNVTLIRIGKNSKRMIDEAGCTQMRYQKFLDDAKLAYNGSNGKWPISLNGYQMDEDEFNDKLADAMDRVETARKELKDHVAIEKKIGLRKGVLKAKKRELMSLRTSLVRQAEQVKINSALAEVATLKSTLGMLNDLKLELDTDPTKVSVEEMTAEDPNAARKKRVNEFLNK